MKTVRNKSRGEGVATVEFSENRKLGGVSATYVGQSSCPGDCPLMGKGCYAELGRAGIHTRRLNRQSDGDSPLALARREADGIRRLSGVHPLRLHVVGDCRTDAAAREVSAACSVYSSRHGQPSWGYTHAWRRVNRESWGGVSILASVETLADAHAARERGYAPALVVAEHAPGKVEGLRMIPCPEQTGKAASCVDCRLCWDDRRLHAMGGVIQFSAHGGARQRVVAGLVQIKGKGN